MSDADVFFDPEDERIDEINENLKLIQKKNGLIFGTDSYFLSAYVEKRKDSVACELGCGTGVASFLLLTKEKAIHAHAVEIQETFCTLAQRNARLNRLEDKITVYNSDIRDIGVQNIGGECDIVISNPPYMTTDSGYRNRDDEKYIARHEVYGNIGDFCACAGRLLRSGGDFYCVYRPDRLADLFSAMKANSLEPKFVTFVHADASSRSSLALIRARKDAGESLIVTRPLFIYRRAESGARDMTADAQAVYDTCSFEHITKR